MNCNQNNTNQNHCQNICCFHCNNSMSWKYHGFNYYNDNQNDRNNFYLNDNYNNNFDFNNYFNEENYYNFKENRINDRNICFDHSNNNHYCNYNNNHHEENRKRKNCCCISIFRNYKR